MSFKLTEENGPVPCCKIYLPTVCGMCCRKYSTYQFGKISMFKVSELLIQIQDKNEEYQPILKKNTLIIHPTLVKSDTIPYLIGSLKWILSSVQLYLSKSIAC